MRTKKYVVALLTLVLIILVAPISFAQETDIAFQNANKFKFLTLIPPIVSILLAFITKNVVISLFIGILSGSFLLSLNSTNLLLALPQGFIDFIYRALNSLADPWNAGIILQVLAIGGVIHLVAKMGGAKAIAISLADKAKSSTGTQIITWFFRTFSVL